MAYALYIICPPCNVPSNDKNLTEDEHNALHDLTTKYELLFNVTLGTWKTKSIDIELHTNAKPHHTKLYPVQI